MAHLSTQAIDSVLTTKQWQSLRPNFPAISDLLPQHLNADVIQDIGKIVSVMASDNVKTPLIAPFGSLTPFTDYAEQKSSYRLHNRLGTMIVHVLPFPSEEPSMSTSPYLTRILQNPAQTLFEYSDPRTYLTLPLSDETSLSFQEDGGTAHFTFGLATLSRLRAERNIHNFGIRLSGVDLERARNEMAHTRHHLRKPGYLAPLLIDVPVLSRT